MGGLPTPLTVQAVASHPKTAKTILIGTPEGLFRTTDGGEKWTAITQGLGKVSITSLAIHPQDPQLVFAATAEGAIYKSQDGGQRWQQVN